MSDEAAFLRAIQADPADATAKLVYADWLDEHGESEKAKYLRLAARTVASRRANEPERLRFYELERRHSVWVELLNQVPPIWDEVTMYALGRLSGLLDAFSLLNGHESDIVYRFDAHLSPRTSAVAEMAEAHFGKEYSPARLLPFANWETELGAIFRDWLYHELRHLRNGPHFRLSMLTERGQESETALAHIRAVINPTAGYRVQVTRNQHFYALG